MSRALALALLLLAAAGCDRNTKPGQQPRARERQFESVCRIIRSEVLEQDDKGNPLLTEIELDWDPCPGHQYQVIRGGPEFSRCMAQYERNELVSVRVAHWWTTRGRYTWDIERVGDCKRDTRGGREGSFEKSQECEDLKLQGLPYGFKCDRLPKAKLVAVCPWLQRD